MRQSRSRQSGFTLIEIAVVVIILATISAISLFAINQAFDRRFVSQADNLLVWFNQLSDQAALEAVPYGVMDNRQEAEEPVRFFQVVAYYRQYWLPVKYLNPSQWRRAPASSGLSQQPKTMIKTMILFTMTKICLSR